MKPKMLAFKARVADADEGQKMLEKGAKVGESDVIVAAFGVPDNGPPVGVGYRQIIDHGAFRTAFDELGGGAVLPMVLDHADAHIRGFPDSTKVLGRAENFREEDEDARFRGFWNLETQVGRESFSNAVFNPSGTPFSFRWVDDVAHARSDGFEHVTEFHGLKEVSQLSVSAAQMATGVLVDTIQMRIDEQTGLPVRASLEQIQEWLKDEEFAGQLRTVLKIELPPIPEAPVINAVDILKRLDEEEELKTQLQTELRSSIESRDLLRAILEEASKPDEAEQSAEAVSKWYQDVWAARQPA